MTRKEELQNLFKDAGAEKQLVAQEVIENVCFLEEQISNLRKLPQLIIHPEMPELQRRSEASKILIPYLQQYNISVKFLTSLLLGEAGENDGVEILEEFRKKVESM